MLGRFVFQEDCSGVNRFGGGHHLTSWRPVHGSERERMASETRVVVDGTEGDA